MILYGYSLVAILLTSFHDLTHEEHVGYNTNQACRVPSNHQVLVSLVSPF